MSGSLKAAFVDLLTALEGEPNAVYAPRAGAQAAVGTNPQRPLEAPKQHVPAPDLRDVKAPARDPKASENAKKAAANDASDRFYGVERYAKWAEAPPPKPRPPAGSAQERQELVDALTQTFGEHQPANTSRTYAVYQAQFKEFCKKNG
jgi:hypothetical protein